MSVEPQQARLRMPVLGALCWLIGTRNEVLAVRLGFVISVALLGGLAAVLLLDLPLFIFGILVGAMTVSFRIAVPIVLHFVPVPTLDWQPVPVRQVKSPEIKAGKPTAERTNMKVGIIGISLKVASDILLHMEFLWPGVEASYLNGESRLKSVGQAGGIQAIFVGGDALPLEEQTREVRRVWDGALIAFSMEPSEQELEGAISEGADDYLALPMSAQEMVWRISAVLRRFHSE